jgi:lysophospholipase L1-like esterase
MAVILWGTNDLAHGISVAQYTANMTAVVQACEANGTIPILTTIPPRSGYALTYPAYAQAMRDLATQLNVPLIDYNTDILTRRPGTTWLGTIIDSGDGTHPTSLGSQNFSATALASDGYALRNYDTMTTMYNVMVPEPVSLSVLALGGLALLRRRK